VSTATRGAGSFSCARTAARSRDPHLDADPPPLRVEVAYDGRVKLFLRLVSLLFLAGCGAGSRSSAPGFRPTTVTEPAWPSVAACLAATHAAWPGSPDANRSCVRIDVENALSPAFVVQAVEVEVDGARLYAREEPPHQRGELDLVSTFTVGLGQMAPGPHEVRLGASLVPNEIVEPSLHGRRWRLCAKHSFTVAPGAGLNVTVQVYENRAEQRPVEQWPVARYLDNGVEMPPFGVPGGVVPDDSECPRLPLR
jgi:hypothetical protein